MASLPYDPTAGAPAAVDDPTLTPLPYDPARIRARTGGTMPDELPPRIQRRNNIDLGADEGSRSNYDIASWPVVKEQEAAPAAPAAANDGNLATDVAKTVGGGAVEGSGFSVRGVGEALRAGGTVVADVINAIFGTQLRATNPLADGDGGIPVADWLEKKGQAIKDSRSESAKQAVAKSTATGNLFDIDDWRSGKVSLGTDPSIKGYLLQGADLLGQMAPQIAAAVITRGASLRGQMIAGGLAGGAAGAGAAAAQAKEWVESQSDEQLVKSSAKFAELVSGGMDPIGARAEVSRLAQAWASTLTAPVSIAGGAVVGGLLGKLGARGLEHAAKGPVSRAAVGAGVGAFEEATQETAEGVATQAGINVGTGAKTDLGEGSAANAIGGLIGGGVAGSARGMLHRPGALERAADAGTQAAARAQGLAIVPPGAAPPAATPVASGRPRLSAPQPAGEALPTPVGTTTVVDANGDIIPTADAASVEPTTAENAATLAKAAKLRANADALASRGNPKDVAKAEEIRARALLLEHAVRVDEGAHEAATSPRNDLPEPTDAQREANNAKLGHVKIGGLDISIEQPEGSKKTIGADGDAPFEREHTAHYGYLRGSEGADGEHVDVYVKPGTSSDYEGPVFVVDQKKRDGSFDETKSMLGYADIGDARRAYNAHFPKDQSPIGAVTEMAMPAFKEWLNSDASKGPAHVDEANARGEQDRALQAVDQREGSDRESGQPLLPQLRGQGGDVAPRVGDELPGVQGGRGAAAESGAQPRPDQERAGLRAGERPVGDAASAGEQPTQERIVDGARTDADVGRVGEGSRDGSERPVVPQEPGDVRPRSGDDSAARRTTTSQPVADVVGPGGAQPKRKNQPTHASPIVTALARRGGIHLDIRSDIVGDKSNRMIRYFGPLFRRTGLREDQLAAALRADGYMTQADIDAEDDNGGANKAMRIIADELRVPGSTVTPVSAEDELYRRRDAAYEADIQRRADELGIDTRNMPIDEMVEAIAQQTVEDEFDERELESSGYDDLEPRERAAVDAALDAAWNNEGASTTWDEWDGSDNRLQEHAEGRGEGEAGDSIASQSEEGDGGREEASFLTSESPSEGAERLAREDLARRDAERNQRAADQRAAADAAGNDFKLTGSDREADRRAAEGQASLLDARAIDSRIARTLFDAFSDLGTRESTPDQAFADAAYITGLSLDALGVRVVDGPPSMGPKVPMRLNLDTREIEVNPTFEFRRGEAAQYAVEELLHASDVVGGRSIAAGSKRLLPGGDIHAELTDHVNAKDTYAAFFGYPMNDNELSPQRTAAELFARLGTLYFGDGARMRQSLPQAYEAFHELYRRHQAGPTDLQGEIRSDARGLVQTRVRPGDGRRDVRTLQGSGGRGQESRVGRLRREGARIFQADPRGSHVGESLEARVTRQKTDVPEWLRSMSAATQEAARKAGAWAPKKTFKDRIDELRKNLGMRLVQNLVDQFAPIKELDPHAYMLARLTKASDAAVETLLFNGRPFLNSAGAMDVHFEKGGLMEHLKPLGTEVDRFFAWIAGNRAAQLKRQGRENLFTTQDITALKDLNKGAMAKGVNREDVYHDAHAALNRYSKAVLDVAERAGLIDGAERHTWENEFYVPFYRVLEQDNSTKIGGPSNLKGLTNQYAFKKLEGGTEVLNDLLANTLKNWSHLLAASLKNQAARASLVAAQRAGVATPLRQAEKGSVFYLDKGAKQHFSVDDDGVMTAITALESVPIGGLAMKWMGKFKHALTLGVTINPAFRVRNLIRDSVQAIGTNPMSFNIGKNLVEGWQGSAKDSVAAAKGLVGGGFMHFGTGLEGDQAAHTKKLLAAGVDSATVLDTPAKIKSMIKWGWNWWEEVGSRSENITRAAIYKQMTEQALADGKSADEAHLLASFAARDSMDFSMQGASPAVRMLTQVVPFMNARAQGLYKLGRAAREDKVRFGIVLGAVALSSIALMVAYHDDDDWKRREEFDRDNYWWFKVGGKAFRIPKPFEFGALGSIAERGIEMLMDGMDADARKRFMQRVGALVWDNLAMNPTPQIIKPGLEAYYNKSTFTGRPIETAGMEKMSPENRIAANTSATAQLVGKADVLSPVVIDHLIQGYFGWLGAHYVALADLALRPMMGLPEKPAKRVDDYPLVGDFVKDLPSDQSRYVTRFYEQSKTAQQAMADMRNAYSLGQTEKGAQLLKENRVKIEASAVYAKTQQGMSAINKQIQVVQASKATPAEKRAKLDELYQQRNKLAESADVTRKGLEARPQ